MKATKKAAATAAKKRRVESDSTLKNPVGRPSEYRPEYCDALVEYVRRTGTDPGEFAVQIGVARGVARQTFVEWGKAHAEFDEAFKRALTVWVIVLVRKLLDAGDASRFDQLLAIQGILRSNGSEARPDGGPHEG